MSIQSPAEWSTVWNMKEQILALGSRSMVFKLCYWDTGIPQRCLSANVGSNGKAKWDRFRSKHIPFCLSVLNIGLFLWLNKGLKTRNHWDSDLNSVMRSDPKVPKSPFLSESFFLYYPNTDILIAKILFLIPNFQEFLSTLTFSWLTSLTSCFKFSSLTSGQLTLLLHASLGPSSQNTTLPSHPKAVRNQGWPWQWLTQLLLKSWG